MSSQFYFITFAIICALALYIAIHLWLSAEKDLNVYMAKYYKAPRIKGFPIKRSRFRRRVLSVFFIYPLPE